MKFFHEYKKSFQESFDTYFFPDLVAQIRESKESIKRSKENTKQSEENIKRSEENIKQSEENIKRNKEILKKIQEETAEIKEKIEKREQLNQNDNSLYSRVFGRRTS